MIQFPAYFKATCYMLLLIMVLTILYMGQTFLIPMSLGVLLSFLLMPVSRWQESKGVPKTIAILLSILLMVLLMTGLVYFLSSQMLSFREEIPMLKDQINAKFRIIQELVSVKLHISPDQQIEWLQKQVDSLVSSSGDLFGSVFSATGNFLAAATLIPIYIFFFIYYRHKIIEFIKLLTPENKHRWVLEVLHSTSKVSQKYLVGLLIDITILSVLNSIGFLLLGIKHAILLAVIAAILNIIPYVGVMIGSIFPIAMALITKDSMWYAVGVLGVCVFVQFLDNNFITPNVVGSAVSINPLATLLTLLVGGMLWGVAGMMLFIPFLGMLKVIMDNVDKLKPFGFLIGEEEELLKKKRKIYRIKL